MHAPSASAEPPLALALLSSAATLVCALPVEDAAPCTPRARFEPRAGRLRLMGAVGTALLR